MTDACLQARERLLLLAADQTRGAAAVIDAERPETRRTLRAAIDSFLAGYRWSLQELEAAAIAGEVAGLDPELRGFAFEGVGAGLTELEDLAPSEVSRLTGLFSARYKEWWYLVAIGVGWGTARLGWPVDRTPEEVPGAVRGGVADGYGFYLGLIGSRRSSSERPITGERELASPFDYGLGRSLWFRTGGHPVRIADNIDAFPADRHADLWTGVGTASAYTGGVSSQVLDQLFMASGEWRGSLRRGAATAATLRQAAGHVPLHTRLAVEAFG